VIEPQQLPKVIQNPYRFLRPFTPEDAEIFKGRDREIKVVLNNVLATRVTALYAPSGAGKTSLINAGLVPRLKEEGFVPITVRPRPASRPDNPLAAIQDQIRQLIGSGDADADLPSLISSAAERGGGPVLLICDQFEELFIHFSDTPEQERLKQDCLQALGRLWAEKDLPVYLVFSLREDHVGNLIEFKDDIPVIYANSIRLLPLNLESAQQAIEEPAAHYHTSYEPECRNLILKDLAQGQWVEAARLQIVCHRLWEACRPREGDYTFTRNDYQNKLGGAKKVVERYLDDSLQPLTPGEHDLAIEMLAYLTRDKRRTARSAPELAAISTNPKVSSGSVISTLERCGLIRSQRWREELWYELTSEFAIDAISKAKEALDQARVQKRQRAKTLKWVGASIGLVVVVVGFILGGMIFREERTRSRDLFESRLTHGALQAANEDLAGALQTLRLGREVASVVSPTRRHALGLLAWYAESQGGEPERTFSTHKGNVVALAISPDGRFVSSGGDDKILRIRDLVTGNVVRELPGHKDIINSLCFNPKGQWIASGSKDKTIKLWRTSDWKILKDLSSGESIAAVACSPNGRWLAAGSYNGNVTLWDTQTWKTKWTGAHSSLVESVNFSPDSNYLASASQDATVRIWEVKSGKTAQVLKGHNSNVNFVVFSPDGKYVTSAGVDKSIRVWNIRSGESEKILTGHKNMVLDITYLPGGDYLASGSFDRSIRVWDLNSGITVRVLQGHEAGVTRIAVTRDGKYLVSSGNDGTVKLWQWRPHSWLHTWDTQQDELFSVAIDPEEKRLVTGDRRGDLVVWDLSSRQRLKNFKAHDNRIRRLAFSPDGRLLASASYDKTIKLWDTKSFEEIRTFKGHSDIVYTVTFSPDGRYLASAGVDGHIGLWGVETSEKGLVPAHNSRAYTVAFSPDGRLLASGGQEGDVILWDLKPGSPKRLRTLSGHTDMVFWVAFSPDGKNLASVGRDQVVRFWDVATGSLIRSLLGHENAVYRAAFSPDGGHLATVSADQTLRFWDAERRQALLTLSLPGKMWDFSWSRSGRWIAIPYQNGTVSLYDLGDLYGRE
jgi:WD40 repeat protein